MVRRWATLLMFVAAATSAAPTTTKAPGYSAAGLGRVAILPIENCPAALDCARIERQLVVDLGAVLSGVVQAETVRRERMATPSELATQLGVQSFVVAAIPHAVTITLPSGILPETKVELAVKRPSGEVLVQGVNQGRGTIFNTADGHASMLFRGIIKDLARDAPAGTRALIPSTPPPESAGSAASGEVGICPAVVADRLRQRGFSDQAIAEVCAEQGATVRPQPPPVATGATAIKAAGSAGRTEIPDPMQVEVTLGADLDAKGNPRPAFYSLPVGAVRSYAETDRFVCDQARVRMLAVRKVAEDAAGVTLQVTPTLVSEWPLQDVDVTVALVSASGEELGSQFFDDVTLGAWSQSYTPPRAQFTISAERWRAQFAEGLAPKVRVVLDIQD